MPLYLAASVVPDGGLFRAERFRDVHLYGGFASAIADGRVPYRDFFLEYPPGALAVFMPPQLAAAHYIAVFKLEMAFFGVITLILVAATLARLGASDRRIWAGVLAAAVSPLALGPIALNTYDAWPAALVLGALAALLWERPALGFGLLGLAFAAKVYPAVLLLPALLFVWRRDGPRRALDSLAVFACVAAILVVPFAALAPHGLADSFRAQASRSLQVESLGGQTLVAADHLGAYSATVVHRTEHAISYDLAGGLPDALAIVSSVFQALAVLAVAALYARGADSGPRLALAFAAAVAGFLAFTRFFSPQYLVWLVPLVLLASRATWLVLGIALVLAQTWFFHYGAIAELGARSWVVLTRDLVVAALFGVLAIELLRRHAPEHEHAILLEDEPPLPIAAERSKLDRGR